MGHALLVVCTPGRQCVAARVQGLAEAGDAGLQRVALEALYAHALLAGRHPLTPFDSALVARALPALIDRAVEGGPS